MATRVPRPVAVGVNARGIPTWDGLDNRLFREACGVPQGIVARALSQTTQAVGTVYENERAVLAMKHDKMEKYFEAVERMAALRDATAEKSLAALKERMAARRKA